jgi:hypothetical protein
MPKFRKKPVEIQAKHWDGSIEGATVIIDWVLAGAGTARYRECTTSHDERTSHCVPAIAIDTLEGTMKADPGYWIIRGVKGEFYPCEPDIFAATYEAV